MDPSYRHKITIISELTMTKYEYIPISFSSTVQLALIMVWQITFSKSSHWQYFWPRVLF